MDKIYIFGHKNPDTDSVTSAISLSYLKNALGYKTEAYILGEPNNETKFVLDYFNIPTPKYLNDTKLQIRDLNYKKNCALKLDDTLFNLYKHMQEYEITGVPIVDNKNKFVGIVTVKDLLKEMMNPKDNYLYTSFENILNTLKGKQILKYDNEIIGNIIISAYNTEDFIEKSNIDNNTILITGNRSKILKEAISKKVKLLIIVGDSNIDPEIIKYAKQNKINLIYTKYDSNRVSKLLSLSNYIKHIVNEEIYALIEDTTYVNDFEIIFNKYKFTNYPIVNKYNRVLGLLRMEDIHSKNKKKVILVDHNEETQSVDGLEEAEILEIVDHHKVGSINSKQPINFRNQAVGSTNTIIYQMFKEYKINIPKEIAGLMLSGIISDTLIFHSPTTTIYDKKAVSELSKIANIDVLNYGKKMFEAGASIKGKTIEEIIYNDFKSFNINKTKVGIGQISTINYKVVLNEKEKYLEIIENISKEQGYDIFAFLVTDVINSNSYLLFNEKSRNIFESSLNLYNIEQGIKLKGIVSRKKQLIPMLMDEIN